MEMNSILLPHRTRPHRRRADSCLSLSRSHTLARLHARTRSHARTLARSLALSLALSRSLALSLSLAAGVLGRSNLGSDSEIELCQLHSDGMLAQLSLVPASSRRMTLLCYGANGRVRSVGRAKSRCAMALGQPLAATPRRGAPQSEALATKHVFALRHGSFCLFNVLPSGTTITTNRHGRRGRQQSNVPYPLFPRALDRSTPPLPTASTRTIKHANKIRDASLS
jgi:hypothetical protein